MPTQAIWAYLERLPELIAETQLMAAETAMLPHLEQRDRRQVLKRLNAALRAARITPQALSEGALRAKLRLMGIGYRRQPREPERAES